MPNSLPYFEPTLTSGHHRVVAELFTQGGFAGTPRNTVAYFYVSNAPIAAPTRQYVEGEGGGEG